MDQVIGRCSICDGSVVVPEHWSSGIAPPAPTCQKCGARKARSDLPVIPMEPSTRPSWDLKPGYDIRHWYQQQTARAVNTMRMGGFHIRLPGKREDGQVQ